MSENSNPSEYLNSSENKNSPENKNSLENKNSQENKNSSENKNSPENKNSSENISPVSFLDSVALAYAASYHEMSDICFVFPNKRSGTFFLKKLSENIGNRALLAPEVMDVAEFMRRISGLEEAPRVDMLFRLYKIYCSLAGRNDELATEQDLLDFDRFAPWGEVILSDFSEVEQYDVDAASLFRNIRDYRSIASNFLTQEQCDVIERYFGYRPAKRDVDGFWQVFDDLDDSSRLKEKFIELWQLLPELFSGLVESLEKEGLAMPGTLYRRAMQRVEEEGRTALPWPKVVVVGFNMLSVTEARLFGNLRDMKDEEGEPYAEFFWDATGPVLGRQAETRGTAARAMRRNMRNFPMPEWANKFIMRSAVDHMPAGIRETAAPSNAAQTKIAAEIIKEWLPDDDPQKREENMQAIRNARAAVVIPDENLLMPLLHSLPPALGSINLTMGYSMRFTSVASFIYHLRRLQSRRRKIGDDTGFYYDDLRIFLSHPLVHVVIGSDKANEISGEIMKNHMRLVTQSWIASQSSELAEIVRPVARTEDAEGTVAYIESVLQLVDNSLSQPRADEKTLPTVNSKLERSQIALYRMALMRLLHSVRRHGISMHFHSVFHLIDRLLAGEKVTFEGKPVEGLQIMGLLETRAIDFDKIIILSMNDKVMPRRSRKRTFIPDSLRHGYGLPTPSQAEELYSYYFYRLLSRASDVTLVYDARAGEGMRSGGKSRYLMQLEMLYNRDRIEHRNYTFMLDSDEMKAKKVDKNDKVMQQLEAFRREGEEARNLSASALMNYCSCPLKFYFKNVANINDDSTPDDYIDPITQGNIMHEAMLNLYLPETRREKYLKGEERIVYTAQDFARMLDDGDAIELAIRRAVNKKHYHIEKKDPERPLAGAVKMVADRLVSQAKDIIRHDRNLAPIEMIGGEFSDKFRWKVGDSPEVNFRYAFDRVDRVDGRYRVIDYKTGSSHVEAEQFDDIFSGVYTAKYAIQLLLYAHWLEERVGREEGISAGDIRMEIYDTNTIGRKGAVCPSVGGDELPGHKGISPQFLRRMEEMLTDIFDPEKPFEPTENPDNCAFCAYRSLCGLE